jgi:hypothetical protein
LFTRVKLTGRPVARGTVDPRPPGVKIYGY